MLTFLGRPLDFLTGLSDMSTIFLDLRDLLPPIPVPSIALPANTSCIVAYRLPGTSLSTESATFLTMSPAPGLKKSNTPPNCLNGTVNPWRKSVKNEPKVPKY